MNTILLHNKKNEVSCTLSSFMVSSKDNNSLFIVMYICKPYTIHCDFDIVILMEGTRLLCPSPLNTPMGSRY